MYLCEIGNKSNIRGRYYSRKFNTLDDIIRFHSLNPGIGICVKAKVVMDNGGKSTYCRMPGREQRLLSIKLKSWMLKKNRSDDSKNKE